MYGEVWCTFMIMHGLHLSNRMQFCRVNGKSLRLDDWHVIYACAKVSRALEFLKYSKNCFPRKLLSLSIEVSLSHIFVTVAPCEGAVGKPGFLQCRSYKIVQPK